MTEMAEQKMPVVFPKVWVGKSSAVPDEVRKKGVPFVPLGMKADRNRATRDAPVRKQRR